MTFNLIQDINQDYVTCRLSPYEIAGLDVILGMHTLKPMDPQVVRRKIRRVTRHRNYDAAKFVSYFTSYRLFENYSNNKYTVINIYRLAQ